MFSGGCAVRIRGRQRPLVKVQGIDGSLELKVHQDFTETTSSGITFSNESSYMTEELNLSTHGDVFDSKLLTYAAGIGLGLSQLEYEHGDESGSSSGDMKKYNLMGSFLAEKPYPFSLSTRKSEYIVSREFQSPVRAENTTNAFFVRLRVPKWPMSFAWTKSELIYKSDNGNIYDSFTQNNDRFSYFVSHDFSERSHMDFRSDLFEVNQQGSGYVSEMNTATHRLLHDYKFGDDEQHSFNSSLYYMDISGDFESQSFNWNETLNLRHTGNFSTFYSAYLINTAFGGYETETTGGMAGFSHRLYDNLGTNFSLSGSQSDYGSNSTSEYYSGKLSFDYYRRNPWGLLRSDYSVRMTTRENRGSAGTGIMTDEPHTFEDPFEITLNERNVIPDSIVITDSTGVNVYTEGVDGDYTVRQEGDRTIITIDMMDDEVPNISDNDDLLIDYLILVDSSVDQDVLQQTFKLEQEFKNGVAVYYSIMTRQSETEIVYGSGGGGSDDEFETSAYGARYRKKYFTFRAEHRETMSKWNSSSSDHLSVSNQWPLSSKTLLRGRMSQTWMESEGAYSRESSIFKAGLGINTRLTKHLRLSGNAEMRKEDNSQIGPTNGWNFGTSLQYNRRALSIRAGWDYYILERAFREQASSTFYIRLIRRF